MCSKKRKSKTIKKQPDIIIKKVGIIVENIELFIKEKEGQLNFEDNIILNEVYSLILSLERNNNITIGQLDKLLKKINYLDQKHDDFYKLVNLFAPIYVEYKKKIKDRYVKFLIEKNRIKKERITKSKFMIIDYGKEQNKEKNMNYENYINYLKENDTKLANLRYLLIYEKAKSLNYVEGVDLEIIVDDCDEEILNEKKR